MNKLVIVSAIVGVLGASWAGSTWYVGQQTEQQLKSQIEQANQAIAQTPQLEGVKLALVDYQKSFMDASGKVKVSLPKTLGENTPESIDLLLTIQHGPILLTSSSPKVAMSAIQSRLDLSTLNADIQKQLKALFNNKDPLTIDTQLNFGNSADYTMVVNPLSYEDDNKTGAINFSGLNLTGSTALSTDKERQIYEGPINGKIGKLEVKIGEDLLVLLPESDIKGQAKGYTDGELISSAMELNMPGISVKAKELPEPISFGLNLKSTGTTNETDTAGSFGLTVSDLMTPLLPTSKGIYDIKINGLNTAGLKEVKDLLAQVEPLQNELRLLDEMNAANQTGINSDTVTPESEPTPAETPASTTPTPDADNAAPDSATNAVATEMAEGDTTEGVAEGDAVAAVPEDQAPPETPAEEDVLVEESPEVQAKRAELEKKRDELMAKVGEAVVTKVLQPNKSHLQQDISLENKLGAAKLNLDLTYAGNKEGKSLTMQSLEDLQPEQALQLVRGTINFNFDRDLFPMAALFLDQPFIVKDNAKYKMSLQLAGDKLVLNDKPMTLTEFQALLAPAASSLGGGEATEPEATDTPSPDAEQDNKAPTEGNAPEATPVTPKADTTKPMTN